MTTCMYLQHTISAEVGMVKDGSEYPICKIDLPYNDAHIQGVRLYQEVAYGACIMTVPKIAQPITDRKNAYLGMWY